MVSAIAKISKGQFFTQENPFRNDGFQEWANGCDLKHQTILEPFAGSNNLIKMLKEMDLCQNYKSFDIEPNSKDIITQDTIKNFPKGFNVCITNPPYLAKNSATRKNINYDFKNFDDLYKVALDKCLNNCEYVGAIIPASFLNSKLFRERLTHYILLNGKMFIDTDCPVCLALFNGFSTDAEIYEGQKYLGLLSELEKKKPKSNKQLELKFNDKNGKLGLIAIDNTKEPSIRFCNGEKIPANEIKNTSRSITRINVDCDIEKMVKRANDYLNTFRQETYDIFLTPFKGLRKDNRFRRRLDYATARQIINYCYE